MKILYSTTIGETMCFFQSFIRELTDNGHTVDIATNETASKVQDCYRQWGCRIHPLFWSRSPVSLGNIKAIYELRKVVNDGGYDIVHCHTPIAAACTRLACRPLRKNGLKVIYTAHGFHFYKGAPLKNWLIFYPIEKLCAHWTDVLITINKEDFELAKKKLKAKRIEYVPGVGIDVDKFKNTVIDKDEKRKELGIPADSFVILSVGELNENKNHQIIIKALGEIADPKIHYVIAGSGDKAEELQGLADSLGVNLHLLGSRNDVAELYKMADINAFPSIREGFGLAAIEGMAADLPLICSDNRGTRSYADSDNSIVCKHDDVDAFKKAILTLFNDNALCRQLGKNGQKTASLFDVKQINPMLKKIYKEMAESI